MLNMSTDSETTTDGFRNYLLEYFENDFLKKIINHTFWDAWT